MYQNCCKKCGSISLHTEQHGNNVGLYCDDCGAWIKWLGKDELRAFEHAKELSTSVEIINNNTTKYNTYYSLNIDKINTIDDCKKVIKFLSDLTVKPLPDGVGYSGFNIVEEFYK